MRLPISIRGLVVLLLLAAAGWWFWGSKSNAPASAGAMGPLPVTVSAPVKKKIVEWNEYTGQFIAVDLVEIRSRVSGYLQSIHFEDGQIVKKGDLLFVVDPRPYEAALASAKAQLEQAQAKAELAKRQLERAQNLKDKGFETGSNFDERLNDKRASDAAIDVARAAVRTAELDLQYTHLTAPITGRISKHLVSEGNLVAGGNGSNDTLLTTIVSVDPIQFNFDLSESDYLTYQRAIAEGKLKFAGDNPAKVFVRLADENDWAREGKLDFIDNQIDRSAGTIRARATFPNTGNIIASGQFGRIRVPASEEHEVLLLPDSAVLTDQSQKIVMTVGEDGSVIPKIVTLGSLQDGLRVIRIGVSEGDRVIVNGLMRARPGSKVLPQAGTISANGQVTTDAPASAAAQPTPEKKP